MRYYVDTSIWRDYFEDRKDNIRPLGVFAFKFLKKCQKEKSTIVVSDIVIDELEKGLSKEQVETALSEFADIILKVNHTDKQVEETLGILKKSKRRIPFADTLHAVIARDENATLVTRDRHFAEINIVEAKAPEDLL